jgi:hypothetical protein
MLISSARRRILTVLALLIGVVWGLFTFPADAQSPAAHTSISAENANLDNSTPDKQPMDIPNIHKQPFFWTVMVASLLGWVLGMVKGFDGSKDWLTKYWSAAPKPCLFGIDLLIFVIVGAYVGTGLYQPATFTAALGAGLSWPVALGALVSKTADPNKQVLANIPAAVVPRVNPAVAPKGGNR